jgi:hypothetical protein
LKLFASSNIPNMLVTFPVSQLGLGSGATRTVFSRAEIIAQRATYDAAFSENLVNPRVLGGLILDL